MTTLTFDMFGLSNEATQAVAKMGFVEPSPIQAAAIPLLMAGQDMIGQAQTGTGKTAAFALPLLEKIKIANPQIQGVVLCPTRELAIQVTDEFRKLAHFKPGLSIVSIYGGQPIERQRLALKRRPHILVATPGRMMDFLRRETFHLNAVETVVLDEADEMLNMGFRDDIEKIFSFMQQPRQTIMFSATMPKPILDLAQRYQNQPARVCIAPQPAEVSQISQTYLEVIQKAKPEALTMLVRHYDLKLALVFCNTKHQVDSLVDHLQEEGFAAEGLHGGKAQNQRERILGRFRKGNTQILVATDVAARGIDVRNIEAVINYDLPDDAENYTHRIGRTGRAGQSGQAFSFVASHQVGSLRQLQKSQDNRILRQTLVGVAPLDFSNLPSVKPIAKKAFSGYRPQRKGHNAVRKTLQQA